MDDEDNIRLLYQEELRDAGYEVSLAGNAEEALRKVEEDPPDLITLDVKMPGMSGFDFPQGAQTKTKRHSSHFVFGLRGLQTGVSTLGLGGLCGQIGRPPGIENDHQGNTQQLNNRMHIQQIP